MHANLLSLLLVLTTIDVTSTTTPKADALIRSICEAVNQNSTLKVQEDRQWQRICHELYQFDDDLLHTDVDAGVPSKRRLRKAARVSGGSRGGGSRTSSGSRVSSGASRSSSSSTRFHSTRTGATYTRPTGWQWSRTRLVFLPLATRFGYRTRSSSSRYTTPTPDSTNYYYCTSNADPSIEIQCNTQNGDTQCCEETTSQQAYCCGGDIPDDLEEDMNRATQAIARVFYTIAGLALGMHLYMRRFYR